jgi:hypothetical protein
VVLDGDTTSPTTLAATDYSLRPRAAVDGVYRWLHMGGQYVAAPGLSGIASDLMPERLVTITGDWGFADIASVPADVKHWVNITVVNWLRKDAEAFSTTFNLADERLERPEALPSAVRAAMRTWAAPKGI